MRIPTASEYAALAESHRRLRAAAQAVIEACGYPIPDGEEPRVYESQLRHLKRELGGEPQPDTS